MKRAVILFSVIAAGIWIWFLVAAGNAEYTVISTERHMSVTDIQQRDCFVLAKNNSGKQVHAYAPSSKCTSLQPGDIIRISDGFVK